MQLLTEFYTALQQYLDVAYCYRRSSVACLSVCVSVNHVRS